MRCRPAVNQHINAIFRIAKIIVTSACRRVSAHAGELGMMTNRAALEYEAIKARYAGPIDEYELDLSDCDATQSDFTSMYYIGKIRMCCK